MSGAADIVAIAMAGGIAGIMAASRIVTGRTAITAMAIVAAVPVFRSISVTVAVTTAVIGSTSADNICRLIPPIFSAQLVGVGFC